MKRTAGVAATWLLLLLFVFESMAWAVSYLFAFEIPYDVLWGGRAGWRMESMRGSLYVRNVLPPVPISSATWIPRGQSSALNGYGMVDGVSHLGGLFETGRWVMSSYGMPYGKAVQYWELKIKHLGVWLLTLPGFLIGVRRWQRECKRRVQSRIGKCASCGYDLRATPDRCPECGAAAKVLSVNSNAD